jgi:hypothetical protein
LTKAADDKQQMTFDGSVYAGWAATLLVFAVHFNTQRTTQPHAGSPQVVVHFNTQI